MGPLVVTGCWQRSSQLADQKIQVRQWLPYPYTIPRPTWYHNSIPKLPCQAKGVNVRNSFFHIFFNTWHVLAQHQVHLLVKLRLVTAREVRHLTAPGQIMSNPHDPNGPPPMAARTWLAFTAYSDCKSLLGILQNQTPNKNAIMSHDSHDDMAASLGQDLSQESEIAIYSYPLPFGNVTT